MITPEELQDGVRLAEKTAITESQLSAFRQAGAPQAMLEERRTQLGSLYAEVMDSTVAEKLLPQARMTIQMQGIRVAALEATLLGEITNAVGNEEQLSSGGGGWMESGMSITNQKAKQHWDNFVEAMNYCQITEAFAELYQLLCEAKWDLIDRTLPPAAPPYHI